MAWKRQNITGGVVITRTDADLGTSSTEGSIGDDELVEARNCLLAPNDIIQVHRDQGRLEFGQVVSAARTIIRSRQAAFEHLDNFLLTVEADSAGFTHLVKYDAAGDPMDIKTIAGIASAAAIIHRGNEYFIGTSLGNYVIAENDNQDDIEVRMMGMLAPPDTFDFSKDEYTYPDGSRSMLKIAWSLQGGASSETVWAPTIEENSIYILYFITEFDSVHDVESDIVAMAVVEVPFAKSGWIPALQLPMEFLDPNGENYYVKINSAADSWRIYRHYIGQGATDENNNEAKASGRAYLSRTTRATGGLIVEQKPGIGFGIWFDDEDASILDPTAITFPLLPISTRQGSPIYSYLTRPKPFTVGLVFNGSVTVDDPSEKPLYRWSPEDGPEYQPGAFRNFFTTEGNDEPLAMAKIKRALIAFLRDSVQKVTNVPVDGAISLHAVQAEHSINRNEGIVGRHAMAVVSSDAGDMAVWLSPQRLMITDGSGSRDACEDWGVSDAEKRGWLDTAFLDGAVLVNDIANSRLMLFLPMPASDASIPIKSLRWDFYYSRRHMKRSGFKCMGPTGVDLDGSPVMSASVGWHKNRRVVFITSKRHIYRLNTGVAQGQMYLRTGRKYFGHHMNEVALESVSLDHAASRSKVWFDISSAKRRQPESTARPVEIKDMEIAEAGRGDRRARGNYLRFAIYDVVSDLIPAPGETGYSFVEQAWGPMWLDVQDSGGGTP